MRYRIVQKKLEGDSYELGSVCECDSRESAELILRLLQAESPGESIWIQDLGKKETLILCAGEDQLGRAWACQEWIHLRGAKVIIAFAMSDFEYIKETLAGLGVPYMVALVAPDPHQWGGLPYDLRMSTFDGEEDFETVFDIME